MKKKIKVAIAGVGNCASALIQGIRYYSSNSNTIDDVVDKNNIKDDKNRYNSTLNSSDTPSSSNDL
ncbi:MAG TPA: hypothetical protein VN704_03950, partial [Verrucomicrobiae bacterium]|nr:hypothetical protein [Verrucomicrobiae bacterium]